MQVVQRFLVLLVPLMVDIHAGNQVDLLIAMVEVQSPPEQLLTMETRPLRAGLCAEVSSALALRRRIVCRRLKFGAGCAPCSMGILK